ncbi:hypothetical protein CXG81DRAFT_13859 [Caulochytrium protostelioides]|uniref:Mitochondrial carrier n=1 Tax=Caulochytrium protostelioides TaxID=1555241 RepID=A0A4P9WYL8_9FUNG|nr:mitochondrial carrier [Caulochytrium protostelioides]RKO99927.1 hypothetical protein CXG81DRAFT_13859 [Caulochytrium protostelioides]|eukprot:RKO99927.1 hypothetical protein CXG81DRAFT_13859 [Caulochytrium protostelioides]
MHSAGFAALSPPSTSAAFVTPRPAPLAGASSLVASPALALSPSPPHAAEPRPQQNLTYAFKTFVAGGLSGCVAKTAIAPLDRVKILFQTANPQYAKYAGSLLGLFRAWREILVTDGFRGLFQGHSATLLRIYPYAAIKFMAYEQFKFILMPRAEDETPWRRLLAGSMAGVSSVFCTYPLDLIRVRLAVEVRHRQGAGLQAMIRQIYREPSALGARAAADPHGIGGAAVSRLLRCSNFYRGFVPTVLGMLPYAGVSFLTYETIKQWLQTHGQGWTLVNYDAVARDGAAPEMRTWSYLAAGALSGALAQTSAYPLEIVRRTMQTATRLSMVETTRLIWQTKGFRGFFVGLTIGYLKVAPMFAVSFWSYELFKRQLHV